MIGIFDSGSGGLTVVKEFLKELPNYKIIYFGDTAHLPYGTKSPNLTKKWSKEIIKFLLKKGAKVIIIACHTASALAFDFLKKEFPKIPIFEIITPGVKRASEITRNRKIGIIGSPATIKSQAHKNKLLFLNPTLKTYSRACPLFVPLVEEGLIKNKETKEIAKNYLVPLKREKIDTLILACTHYPLLKDTISEIIGEKVTIINPAQDLIMALKEKAKLGTKKETASLFFVKRKGRGKHHFYFSDEPYNFRLIAKLCLSMEVPFKVINIDKA